MNFDLYVGLKVIRKADDIPVFQSDFACLVVYLLQRNATILTSGK